MVFLNTEVPSIMMRGVGVTPQADPASPVYFIECQVTHPPSYARDLNSICEDRLSCIAINYCLDNLNWTHVTGAVLTHIIHGAGAVCAPGQFVTLLVIGALHQRVSPFRQIVHLGTHQHITSAAGSAARENTEYITCTVT